MISVSDWRHSSKIHVDGPIYGASILIPYISCEVRSQCLGDLTAAGIMDTDKCCFLRGSISSQNSSCYSFSALEFGAFPIGTTFPFTTRPGTRISDIRSQCTESVVSRLQTRDIYMLPRESYTIFEDLIHAHGVQIHFIGPVFLQNFVVVRNGILRWITIIRVCYLNIGGAIG